MHDSKSKLFIIFQYIIIIYWNIKWNTGHSSRKCDSVWSRIIINTSSCNIITTINIFVMMLLHLLVAVFSVSLTCTLISVDDGLLRTSTGCADISFSLTLYVDWLKMTVIAINTKPYLPIQTQYNVCNSCIVGPSDRVWVYIPGRS